MIAVCSSETALVDTQDTPAFTGSLWVDDPSLVRDPSPDSVAESLWHLR
jgi:hypothetical protein